jgi:hypothetical protein
VFAETAKALRDSHQTQLSASWQKPSIRDADHIPKLMIKLSFAQALGIGELNAEGNNMRKISFFGGVAVLVLIGVGAWIAVGTSTSTSALAASTIDPFAMMTSAKDLPTSHYVDYSLIFN